MDFLERRGLPLTKENLQAWQADLKAREEAAWAKRQELKAKKIEVLREYEALKRKEELLFRQRANQSNRQWSKPIWLRKNLYELIIIANIIMYILSYFFSGLTRSFALFGPAIYIYKQYYRFFTTMFMHGSLTHIFFNMYALYVLGNILENTMGRKRFALVYFGSGILGAAFTYLVNPYILSVGASGAIFGLFGFVLYARIFRYSHVSPEIQGSLFRILGINFLIALLPHANIDVWSHTGGLLGGFLLGMIIGPGAGYLRGDKERQTQMIIGILGITLILARAIGLLDFLL